jgi:hypothetical protein
LEGDCGWAAILAYIDIGFKGKSEPFDQWMDTDGICAHAWEWAFFNDKEARQFIGPSPTWTICNTGFEDGMEFPINHVHSGSWNEWLNSLLIAGRWLHLPALLCRAAALGFAAFIVEARENEIFCYHIGDIDRDGGVVVMLALHNSHWCIIKPRPVPYPDWWFQVRPSWPDPDYLQGGMLKSTKPTGAR